jgi:hypothetical protein
MMEQSSAVKCPSISYHLVGTKGNHIFLVTKGSTS